MEIRNELWRAANLYSDIKAARFLSVEDDNRMTQAFDTHISSVLSQLDNSLATIPQEASLARLVEALLAEHGITDVCFQGVIAMLPESEVLGKHFQGMYAVYAKLYKKLACAAAEREAILLEWYHLVKISGDFGCVKVEEAQDLCKKLFSVAKVLKYELFELRQDISAVPQLMDDHRKHFLVPIYRKMSLASFRDVVYHMCAYKIHADTKKSLEGLLKETTVQQTYSYLREQYGLKSLVVEAATCMHRAARDYGAVSTEVAALSIFAGASNLPRMQ